jgi:RND family efflux transporter MFP subunit
MSSRVWSIARACRAYAAAGAVAVLAACGAAHATSPAPPAVAVAQVTRGPLTRSLAITAELQPFQEVDVHAKISGYVRSLAVDIGDRVQAGDLLATLDVPELAHEVQQADAGVTETTSDITRAESEVTRATVAHTVAHLAAERLTKVAAARPGLVAQQELDEVTARDSAAEAQLATAMAALAVARDQLDVTKANQGRVHSMYDYARITAPFAGVITKRYADTGTMIQAGTSSTTQALPLVRLEEDDRLRLVIPVPESAVPRIRVGGAVGVRVAVLNRSIDGRISRVAHEVEPATRTMHVEVDVANPDRSLVAGMYAEVAIVIDHLDNALVVPVQALDRGESGASVLRVDAKHVLARVPVEVGLETPAAVEITSGLQPGDVVVTGARTQLRVGQVVDPRLQPAATGGR